MKFAMQGAQDNGEFITPPSLAQTIVHVIEPDHATVFDPACGSGGMFVQSSYFIEQRGQRASQRASFFGQEFKTSNLRLAKMNLPVRALGGDIVEANTPPKDSPLRELVKKRDDAAKACFGALEELTARIAKKWEKPCEPRLPAQKKLLAGLDELAAACRNLVKDVDLGFKLAARVGDAAERRIPSTLA